MNAAQIIGRKRDGHPLTAEDISAFVRGFHAETISEAQMSALAMAILLQGMTIEETAVLTDEMLNSGTRLNWPDDGIPRVDKHSTGGVGDKVSLVLAPLLACCEVQVPMLSGRGLGPTGGTLDKLESIAGFRTDLSLTEIQAVTQQVGCVITGASRELAPVDRRLYALRDVTGTVPSVPLITGSIMSKKLAESINALVLDVKVGSGAFMQTPAAARTLAESLVRTGQRMGVTTRALMTDMNQPLGEMVGNVVEVMESIDVLKGQGPADVRELTIALGVDLLHSCKKEDSGAIRKSLEGHLSSGRAYEKFADMVTAQGGHPDALVAVAPAFEVAATNAGCVNAIDTRAVGYATIELGGGRKRATDAIDHRVGIEMRVRTGQTVERGEVLARYFSGARNPTVEGQLRDAITIADSMVAPRPLIQERLGPV